MIARRDDTVTDTTGRALAGVEVYYLTQPADVPALTPLANVYSNTGGISTTNPQITDAFGHAVAYLDDGSLYTVVYVDPLLNNPATTFPYPTYQDQPVGGGSSAGATPQAEVPAGTINGTNVTFTLTKTPLPNTLNLQYNSALLIPGLGYTTAVISGVFTITLATAPEVGDALYARYST